MINPSKMMEAWMSLVSEATRGNTDARETIRSITGASMRPDEMVRMMTSLMPPGTAPVQAEAFKEWLEEYWKTIGVVPRYRYLELLERYEELRLRVEEMENANRALSPLNTAAQQEEAKKVMGMWGNMMEETFKVQQQLLSSWMSPSSTTQDSESASESGTDASGKKS